MADEHEDLRQRMVASASALEQNRLDLQHAAKMIAAAVAANDIPERDYWRQKDAALTQEKAALTQKDAALAQEKAELEAQRTIAMRGEQGKLITVLLSSSLLSPSA